MVRFKQSPNLYSSNLKDLPEIIIGRNWALVAGLFVPRGVIGSQTAFDGSLNRSTSSILTHKNPFTVKPASWFPFNFTIDLATTKNNTPLCFAAWKGQVAIALLLCQKGANVNARTNDGGCALNFAAAAGNTSIVQTLLEFKAQPTVTQNNGGTAYKLAMQNGFTATAQMLKDAGGE
jgi:hypothetical protein